MLLVIAMTALGIGAWLRADRLEKCASWHQEEANRFSISAQISDLSGFPKNPIIEQRSEDRQRTDQAKAEYHESIAAKCRRSVWRPWIQFESDPLPATPATR
jgi:hypothetical protein